MKLNLNFKKIPHKKIWFKSSIGMTIGFFATLIIAAIIQITTINVTRTEESLNPLIQVQNYLHFLTPFAIGISIGFSLKLSPYQIIAIGISATLAAHSSLVPRYEPTEKLILFDQTRLGLNPFKANSGDVFSALIGSILMVYIVEIFNFKDSLYELVIVPLLGVIVGLFATISISPLVGMAFVALQYIIGISITESYALSIILAPIIGCVIGMALPLPISSAALAMAINTTGRAGLIAFAGTTSVTIVMSFMTLYATRSFKKTLPIWFGSPMLLIPKYLKKPIMLLIPLVISFVTVIISAAIFDSQMLGLNISAKPNYVGLGFTSVLLPQILFILDNVYNGTWWLALIHILTIQTFVPILLAYPLVRWVFNRKWLIQDDFEILHHQSQVKKPVKISK